MIKEAIFSIFDYHELQFLTSNLNCILEFYRLTLPSIFKPTGLQILFLQYCNLTADIVLKTKFGEVSMDVYDFENNFVTQMRSHEIMQHFHCFIITVLLSVAPWCNHSKAELFREKFIDNFSTLKKHMQTV